MDHAPSKRRRLDHTSQSAQGTFSTVTQLEASLRFRSSISSETRASIQRFKDFLSGIAKSEEDGRRSSSLRILQDYCGLQTAASKQDVDFPDLIAIWTNAVETSNDPVSSAIPAVLAQFFKTISGLLDFREFGLSLCHSLLKKDQVRLLDRGLSSSKTKSHLISPCLRLLTEVMSFDGGTMANYLFERRDILFKRLDVLLETRLSEDESDRRRPTVRRMSLRLILAALKYLDASAKTEFLMQQRILRSCLQGLSQDGDDIVVDILKTIDAAVIEDTGIEKATKVRIFAPDTLSMLASLYEYVPDDKYPNSASAVREAVHKLLLKVCASSKGVSLSQTGWFPVGYDVNIQPTDGSDYIDLGLDSPQYFDDYSGRVPVKNTTLSVFLHTLQPASDQFQAELLLKVLSFVPELVADFFSKKTKISVAVGDDAKWRSQFAVFFSIVQLPVPRNFGRHLGSLSFPPPTSVIIENILPNPFDRATLTRFFGLNDEILILSGSRLLSVALSKFGQVLDIFSRSATVSPLWQQASRRLIEAVLQRVPKYKDIVEAFQRRGKDSTMARSALFECLAMFHKVLPEATIGSKFDIGPLLLDTLKQQSQDQEPQSDLQHNSDQLQSLVIIAQLSPVTKWWSKSGNDTLSLFTLLLKFAILAKKEEVGAEITAAIDLVLSQSGILASRTANSALLLSLKVVEDFQPSDELFTFLDTSIHRVIQKPVKYQDQIEAEQQLVSDKKTLSLLACSVAEQWTFALNKYKSQRSVIRNIATWIGRFYGALDTAAENFRVLTQFHERMVQASDEISQENLQTSFEEVRRNPLDTAAFVSNDESNATQKDLANQPIAIQPSDKRTVDLHEVFDKPVEMPRSLEGIDRWDGKSDVENAIQSGRIAKLIRCSASEHTEVRLQTFQLLQTLAHVADESTYSEKAQLYLLLGELCETIRQHNIASTPLPPVAAELGVKLLHIIADPTHKLFSKANKFLLRGPNWDTKRIIPQWADRILFHDPESDDPSARTEELEWFTGWLVDGLQTADDMELYRRSGIFEKLLALYSSPATSRSVRKKVLNVLWRALNIGDDGDANNDRSRAADTLITRLGLHEWLAVAEVIDADHAAIIQQLARELDATCNKDVILTWKQACPRIIRKQTSTD